MSGGGGAVDLGGGGAVDPGGGIFGSELAEHTKSVAEIAAIAKAHGPPPRAGDLAAAAATAVCDVVGVGAP